ncbi:hypothetical protein EJ07DRAFT_183099 [Lizonia empirigonia]|nr:hypothetical protein EJ07DRAFT_183099 [Lizonia empirigonia]
MATQEQEPQVTKTSVTLRRPDNWIVYLSGKTSRKIPDNKELTIPPSCGIEIKHPVWTLAASILLAMKEDHPEDAEVVRRLQVLAGKRSGVGQNFTRVAEASGRLSVADLLPHRDSNPGHVVAYFDFDFNDVQKQDAELMLRSLVGQLSQRAADVPASLDALFSSCEDGKRQPSLNELLRVAH